MTRTRLVPAVMLTLLVAAGVSWGQKAPTPPSPNTTLAPYYQQLPQVLFPPQVRNAQGDRSELVNSSFRPFSLPNSCASCCAGEEQYDDGDMASLLVEDCLKMWALLWDDGKYPEAATMAAEACRLDPNNSAAEYARLLSQIATTTRLVHPAAGCPRSCDAVQMPVQGSLFHSGLTPAGVFTPDLNVPCSAASKPCGTVRSPECKSCVPAATCAGCEEACEAAPASSKGACCSAKPTAAKHACCNECCSVKVGCACESKCCSAKKSCACESKCCCAKNSCACSAGCCATAAKCCQAQSACACENKCCSAKNACCTKCVAAKPSCSCCTNCSCGKSASGHGTAADVSGCTFMRMLQGLPALPGQPPHAVIIMNPMPTPVHPPMPTAFMPPLPQSWLNPVHPGCQQMVPPPMANQFHDHLFIPVARPQLPPMPPPAVREGERELIPAPMMIPPPPPNMPLQITASGKRLKVSCPRFEALCNRISHLPGGERILLEGKVRVTYRGHDAGKISAERVEVDLLDGAVEVNPSLPPPRPTVPVGYFTPVSVAPTEP